MRSTPRGLAILLSVWAMLPVGCRNSGGDGTTPADLTAEQQAAIDAVVKQVDASAKAMTGVVDGFAGLDVTSDGTYGACPIVTTSRDVSVISATLEFPEGCENEYYGDVAAGGTIALEYGLLTQSLSIRFDNFTIDGRGVSGSSTLQLTRGDDGGRVLVGEIDITTTQVGSTVGDATIQFNLLSDTITIASADLTVTEAGGNSYAVSVAGVVMRPIANGNFVPEAGNVTFAIPNSEVGPETITIVITYLETTPDDGVVEVTIGSAQPVEYDLPGVGG